MPAFDGLSSGTTEQPSDSGLAAFVFSSVPQHPAPFLLTMRLRASSCRYVDPRNARTASTVAARRAGMYAARLATPIKSATPAVRVAGSSGDTP
jgi:hypothetical protein